MSAERWRRIQELYHAAQARPAQARAAFLEEACAGDATLRQEIESLLAQPVSTDDLLDRPALEGAQPISTRRLAAGTRLGSYEIVGLLGAGGMGEVYRARDTTLGRDVAIKIVPSAFTADAERLARFEREARLLASLNHPNIGGIYGVADAEGVRALVLELVDGPTLAERIAQGPMPLEDALPIARQIADALEAAHEHGIIHRDLKPANIKLRPDGAVKVLDFGLAKALDPAPTADLSQSPTITTPAMTRMGVIMGTAAYMSPEQAKGQPLDKRTDIWAFGCVLYEMLTGRRAFEGEGVSDTLAAVLCGEPDYHALPATTPATVAMVLHRCLQKDRKRRARDMGDVSLALEGAFETAVPPLPPRSRARVLVAVAVSGLVGALVAAAALWSSAGRTPASAVSTRTSVLVPANRPVSLVGYPRRALALSPDGTQLVYVGTNLDAPADQPGGRTQLHLRSFATLAVRDLPATTNASQPFFSPDGQWVGFFTSLGAGELKKIALAGGNPVTLVEKINGSGVSFGVWTEDGTIIFGTNASGLRRVSAEGGAATDLTTLDAAKGELFHSFPALVPSSRAVLFSIRYRDASKFRIDAVLLDSGERRVVVENARAPHVLSSGHLLFQRDEAILIAPFDPERLTVTGPAVPLIDEVRRDSALSPLRVAELAVSRSGTLAYVPAADTASALGLVGRDGAFELLGPAPNNFVLPRVSPDGNAVAFVVVRGQGSEVHLYDRRRGSTTKLTQDGRDMGPAWHPDSRSLAIVSRKKDTSGIFLKSLDGYERLLVPFPAGVLVLTNASWSPDGMRLAYSVQTGLLHDIWVLTMGDKPTTEPFRTSAASEYSPAFSPDGRWLVYQSDESGRQEVYIQRYPQGERIAVSTGGGDGPVWRRDGKELFFQGLEAGVPKMMAVSVTPDGAASLRLAKPVPLFDLRVPGPTGVIEQYADSTNAGTGYDILPDGRFVMVRGANPEGTREIVLVQNWFEELKRLVPTN